MATTNRRAATAGVILGGCLVAAGIVLSRLRFRGAALSQWNGFCTSGIGQFGQIFSAGARRDCRLAAFGDHAIGWLAGIGIALMIGAAVIYFTGRTTAPSAPPGVWPALPPSGWNPPPPGWQPPPRGWQPPQQPTNGPVTGGT